MAWERHEGGRRSLVRRVMTKAIPWKGREGDQRQGGRMCARGTC